MQLSRFDIAAINEARAVLQRIEDAAREEAWGKPSTIQWTEDNGFDEGPYAHSYGMLMANAEQASDALFRFLLTCKHNMHMDITEDDLHNRDAENEGKHWTTGIDGNPLELDGPTQRDLIRGLEDGREPDGQRVEGHRILPTDR